MHTIDDTAPVSMTLVDEAATLALGAALASCLRPGTIIYLYGDLGAGKTTLVRGLLRKLGFSGRVKSPTYTLMEPYEVAGMTLLHYDLYRMQDPREWLDAGFRDDFTGTNACIVEWPDKAAGLLPRADIEIRLHIEGEGRQVQLTGLTPCGRETLRRLDVQELD